MHEKPLVERAEKLIFTLLLPHPVEFVAQVVEVKIQETFFLNKIAEHKAV